MFLDNTLFTFFNNKANIKLNQPQHLFRLFQLFKSNNPNIKFLDFLIFSYIYFKYFNNYSTLLNFFFFLKTPKLLKVFYIDSHLKINLITAQLASFNTDSLRFTNKLNIFWRKFRNLKRPKTEENFNEYFLSSWKKKLSIYEKLNFFELQNSMYLVCLKSDTFLRTFITVNKQLLTAPKLSSSSISKFFNVSNTHSFEFQYLRKNKVYNKGRYSRCRQNYRTGVYMCMYLSVVSIFGLYYWFYKFSFNFTYLWWLFIAFVGSFFLPKIIKYRLYEPTTLLNKLFDFSRWSVVLFKSFF